MVKEGLCSRHLRLRDEPRETQPANKGARKIRSAQKAGSGRGPKYLKRVRQYAEYHGLPTTEDVVAACAFELDQLGESVELSGTRSVWVRLLLDARKQLWVEKGGGRDLSDAIFKFAKSMAEPEGERPE